MRLQRGRCSRGRSPPAPSATFPTSCSRRLRRGRGIRFPLRGCLHGCAACGSQGERSSEACWKGACDSVSRSGRAFARSVSRVPADRWTASSTRSRASEPSGPIEASSSRAEVSSGRRAGGRTSRLAVRPPALAPRPRGGGARDGGRAPRRRLSAHLDEAWWMPAFAAADDAFVRVAPVGCPLPGRYLWLPGTIVVNRRGERFAERIGEPQRLPGRAMRRVDPVDGRAPRTIRAWMIFDERYRAPLRERPQKSPAA